MENKSFKTTFAPTVVLVIICLIVTFALVMTNGATKPTIEKINKANADLARAEVLAEGDEFIEFTGDLNEGIEGYFSAKNKAGVAVTSTSKSFGGTMTVMVGIDADGAITGVKVTGHADTPGLGTKAMTPEYLAGYVGVTELAVDNIKDDTNVDYIVGASVSSNGVYDAVQGALQQFKDCGGVK